MRRCCDLQRLVNSLPRDNATAAGRLRQVARIEVCELSDFIWLRGGSLDERLDVALRALPGARRFEVLNDDQLQRLGARVPDGCLPEGPWQPIADWIEFELPIAALSRQPDDRVPLTTVRSTSIEEPAVLLTTFDGWRDYAVTAPQVRLDRWYFAASADGRTIIRGRPVPSIPGERFVERDGIAIPVGWSSSPPVDAAVIRQLLELEADGLALLHRDGSWERILADNFVRATRSAVRKTAEAMANG